MRGTPGHDPRVDRRLSCLLVQGRTGGGRLPPRAEHPGAQRGELVEGEPRQLGDVQTFECHRQRFGFEPLSVARRAWAASDELRDPFLDRSALGVGERVEDVAAGTDKGALIAGLHIGFHGASSFRRGEARVHRHRRTLLGEQNPLAVLARQRLPRSVDVVAERGKDVAQILPVPGRRP